VHGIVHIGQYDWRGSRTSGYDLGDDWMPRQT